MQQTVFAGKNVNERAKIHDSFNSTIVYFSDFGFRGNFLNHRHRGILRIGAICVNPYATIILDIDVRTRRFGDTTNRGTAFTDHITNFVRVDFQDNHRRSIFGYVCSGFRNNFVHFTQDMNSGIVGLFECIFHDVLCYALDLYVHLQSGNALHSSCNFEIHVPQMIFIAQNISEDCVTISVFNETHGYTRNCFRNRYTRIHQRQRRSTNASHRTRAIALRNLRDNSKRIREVIVPG